MSYHLTIIRYLPNPHNGFFHMASLLPCHLCIPLTSSISVLQTKCPLVSSRWRIRSWGQKNHLVIIISSVGHEGNLGVFRDSSWFCCTLSMKDEIRHNVLKAPSINLSILGSGYGSLRNSYLDIWTLHTFYIDMRNFFHYNVCQPCGILNLVYETNVP